MPLHNWLPSSCHILVGPLWSRMVLRKKKAAKTFPGTEILCVSDPGFSFRIWEVATTLCGPNCIPCAEVILSGCNSAWCPSRSLCRFLATIEASGGAPEYALVLSHRCGNLLLCVLMPVVPCGSLTSSGFSGSKGFVRVFLCSVFLTAPWLGLVSRALYGH